VWIHRYDATARDAHNNPVKAYVPAKDAVGEPVKAIQWDYIENEPSADRTVERVSLFLPPLLRSPDGDPVDLPKATDLVDIPAGDGLKQYEIVGVRDYNFGFHGWQPGYILDLQRAMP
jgi:hypothetical protein